MKDLIPLMQQAQQRLDSYDAQFEDRANTILGILRSSGVVSSKPRWGRWHKLLSATLALAYEDDGDVYVSTRRAGTFHSAGLTTRITYWLDELCEKELLITNTPTKKAEGRLSLSELLTYYLQPKPL